MTLRSLRNLRITRPSIRLPNCCNAALLVTAIVLPAVVAPPVLCADEAVGRKPGDVLLKALQNRSAVDRWILLRREQRKLRKQSERPLTTPAGVQSGSLQEAAPTLSKPFPEPGMKTPENADEPLIGEFSEPVLIEQPVPRPKSYGPPERPDQLRKITEILPYHDYAPDPNSKKAPGTTVPEEFWASKPYQPRKFEDVMFTWEASDLYHNPLYFEDPALERYGHTYPDFIQPYASIGRFGLQLFGLPYQMTIDPVCSKHYALGWYRPGECAPKLLYQIPWNWRAAKVQAGVVTGLFYLIP